MSQTLLAHLRQHTPDDAAEAKHQQAFLDLVQQHPAHLERTYFVPGHATASAFVVVRGPTPSVLLLFHAKLQRWLQPGGHVEPGETDLRDSAVRELLEETGLTVSREAFTLFDIDVHEIPARKADPAHLHFDARYLAVLDRAPQLDTSVEGADARWFTREQLPALDLDPGIRRMIAKCERAGLF